MSLMEQADGPGLESLVMGDRRAVRHVLGRLWDPRPECRRLAAKALGAAAVAHPDLMLDVTRRLTWALNDESATNGVHGVAALGEIGRRNPRLIEAFIQPMASLLWDRGLREELLRALIRIARSAPEVVRPVGEMVAVEFEDLSAEDRRLTDELLHVMFGGQHAS